MNLEHELFTIVTTLDNANISNAVRGGLAVALHGYPRATQDIDILIQEGDLPEAQHRLETIGYTISCQDHSFSGRHPRGTEGISNIPNG